MSVDDHTHTLYAAINTSGGFPASAAVINTATCNGTHTAGCDGPFPHMPTGATPIATALDTSTGVLYVTDGTSAEVTALRTAHCNATDTTGCRTPGRRLPISSAPNAIAIDQDANTVYVTNTYQAGAAHRLRRPALIRGPGVRVAVPGRPARPAFGPPQPRPVRHARRQPGEALPAGRCRRPAPPPSSGISATTRVPAAAPASTRSSPPCPARRSRRPVSP